MRTSGITNAELLEMFRYEDNAVLCVFGYNVYRHVENELEQLGTLPLFSIQEQIAVMDARNRR